MNLASSAVSAHSLFLSPHPNVGAQQQQQQQQQQQHHHQQQTHQTGHQQQQHRNHVPPASLHQSDKSRSPSPRSEFLAIPDGSLGTGFGGGGGGAGGGGGGGGGHATSPTSLTVPSWFNPNAGGSEFWRRVSSTCSSIFDLSGECEQLERAIRDNDVTAVKKFLHVHHGKFPVDLGASILDKSSCDSRSRRHSHVSQDVEILLLKSQTLIESLDRRESINTDIDVPNIFRTSLHLAVQHNADDVLKLLLKFGVDPNEPSTQVTLGLATRRRRASSAQPEMLMQQLQQLHLKRQHYLQQQQQLIKANPQEAVSWDGRSRLSCCSQHSGAVSAAATLARSRSKSCSPAVPPTITLITTPNPCPPVPTITPSVSMLCPGGQGHEMHLLQASDPHPLGTESSGLSCEEAEAGNDSVLIRVGLQLSLSPALSISSACGDRRCASTPSSPLRQPHPLCAPCLSPFPCPRPYHC